MWPRHLSIAFAPDDMTMDDDALMRRREDLQLLRAFLRIADPLERKRILRLVERLAGEPATNQTGLALAPAEAAAVDRADDV